MPILELDDIFMNIEMGIPCGIIINELVSNSLKYAFPDDNKGTVFVGLKDKGDMYELMVSDNGVGIPENFNFDETPETLGLMLVNSLISQLNCNITFNQDYKTELKNFYENLLITFSKKLCSKYTAFSGHISIQHKQLMHSL
jgi:two-component sensor histidine kinase